MGGNKKDKYSRLQGRRGVVKTKTILETERQVLREHRNPPGTSDRRDETEATQENGGKPRKRCEYKYAREETGEPPAGGKGNGRRKAGGESRKQPQKNPNHIY